MTQTQLSDISVLITSYSSSSTLADAIWSGLAETDLNLEIVVVLDGATPADHLALQQFNDPRLRVFSPGRVGRSRALNLGIDLSSSPLVRILDADDRIVLGSLAHQVAFMNKHPEFDAVGGQLIQEGPWGRRGFRVNWPPSPAEIDARLIRGRMPIAHPTVAMRKTFLNALGGYDESATRGEDFDLILRGSRGLNYANMTEPLAVYTTLTEFPTWQYWKTEERCRRAIMVRHRCDAKGPITYGRRIKSLSYIVDFPKWVAQRTLDGADLWIH